VGQQDRWDGWLGNMRKISVAFRSAKVAFCHSFAERKTTIKNRTIRAGLGVGIVDCTVCEVVREGMPNGARRRIRWLGSVGPSHGRYNGAFQRRVEQQTRFDRKLLGTLTGAFLLDGKGVRYQ
jgi:hypothetical protein